MTTKTYGAWEVTEREYQMACKVAKHGTGTLAEGAFQVVRYCNGNVFYRDDAAAFIQAVRTPSGEPLE